MELHKIVSAACLFLISVSAHGLILVENGEPRAKIAIAKDAAGCVPYAASEFQGYIEKISGAKIPIVATGEGINTGENLILIGKSALTQELGISTETLPPDGFRILTKDNILAIVGRDDAAFNIDFDRMPGNAGTLYGVYRLLEDMGVRWFYPSEIGEIVPKERDIIIAEQNVEDAPYFPYRFAPGYGYDKWKRQVGYGGDRDPWASRHTFCSWMMNWWGRFHETHPEYFFVNEKGEIYDRIAFAHEGVTEQIIADARGWFRSGRPEGKRKYFAVIPNDYFRSMCSCSLCQSKVDLTRPGAGWFSDYVGEAVVKVAEALEKEFPDCYIVYCAYERYTLPPKNIERLPSNVVVNLALKRRSLNYSDETKEYVYSIVEAWQKLNPAAIYFLRYYTFRDRIIPLVMPHLIAEDIKQCKRMSEASPVKIKGEMHFGGASPDAKSSWWFHLNEYVTAKLLWNPDIDVDELLNEYYREFYGPAAPAMESLFSKIEQIYYDEPEKTLYSLDTLAELEGYVETARKVTAETAFAPNVEFVDRNFESLRAMKRKIESSHAELQAAPNQDMVLHYEFDAGSGETAQDSSGEGHDGTIHGAMWVEGTAGKALEFDGEDDYVETGSLEFADTDYTIEAWIRPKEDFPSLSDPYKDIWFASGGDYYIVGPQAWDRHSLKISNGRLSLHHRNKSSNILISSPPYVFRAGRWYHVAGTFSKTNGMSLYINGELVAFDDEKVQPSTWSVHVIGASGGPSGFNQFFKGAVDDVRIYRRELPYAEVKRHYQKG